MPYFKKEDIIAEVDKNGKVLCNDCFDPQNADGFKPMEEDDKFLEDHVLICDECTERIN